MTFSPTVSCERCGLSVRLRFETDGFGQVVEIPDPCPECSKPKKKRRLWPVGTDHDRRLAGVCQDCPRDVVGRPKVALYCEACRTERRKASVRKHRAKVGDKHQREWKKRNRKKVNRQARAYARRNRERMNAYKREWRKKNRAKVKMQKRRANLRRGGKSPESLVRYRERVASGEHVPTPARRNEAGERLCLREPCEAVVSGRAKLCDDCRAGKPVRIKQEAAA